MKVNNSFKGLWMPKDILMDTNLTINEKVLFAIIVNLSKNKEHSCKASNSYLSNMMNFTSRRIQQLLSSLKEKNYINTRNVFHEGTKIVSHRLVNISSRAPRKGVHIDNIEDRKVYIEKNTELNEIFYDFIKYRQELKKPLGERSLKVTAQKLVEMSNNTAEKAKEIVNQTIEKGWLSLYELKDKSGNRGGLTEGKILKRGEFNDYSNLGF